MFLFKNTNNVWKGSPERHATLLDLVGSLFVYVKDGKCMNFQEFLFFSKKFLTFTLEYKDRSVNVSYLECRFEAAICLSVR